MNIFQPLSPHLPIYKPQLISTFPISHRISKAFLATIVLFFYLLCVKIGLICFTYKNFYQFLFFSSKLILISFEITTLALFCHFFNGVHHLLTYFLGFIFLRIGRKRLKWLFPNFTYTFENKKIKKERYFLMKCFLLLALIALFFKAYAVEADIELLAFYLHLPDQDPKGIHFVWDELAKTPLY